MSGARRATKYLLLGCLCLASWAQAKQAAQDFMATVTHVHDGDTVWVKTEEGARPLKLRLEGLDAPEICQAGGTASRDALHALLYQQPVRVSTRRRDRYGRALARVQLDDRDVGAWLVSQGHAWSYRYRNSPGPYAREETRARRQGRGVFADPKAEEPRVFRKRQGPCRQR